MDYTRFYSEISQNLIDIISSTCRPCNEPSIGKSYLLAQDIEKWIEILDGLKETTLYKTALNEYVNALLFRDCGLYRQSYMSLRFFLEHTLFGIYLSRSEYDFRRWSIGKKDLSWSEIVDVDKGIFCKDYIEVFSPEFIDKAHELSNISKQLYRELSEYIHGNVLATQTLPMNFVYDNDRFYDINKKIATLRYIITFVLFIRYKEQLNKEQVSSIEQSVFDSIGTSSEIQAFFLESKGV